VSGPLQYRGPDTQANLFRRLVYFIKEYLATLSRVAVKYCHFCRHVTGPDQGFLVSRLVLTLKPWERGCQTDSLFHLDILSRNGHARAIENTACVFCFVVARSLGLAGRYDIVFERVLRQH
jgi:hypothetical protein